MTVLAGLDIATKSGFAAMQDGKIVETVTFLGPKRKRSILDDAKALDAVHEGNIGRLFEDALRVWLIRMKVEHVAIEAPLPGNKDKTETHVNPDADFAGQSITYTKKPGTSISANYRTYGLSFIACAVCARLNIPVRLVNQSTWRKSFLGHGRPGSRPGDAKKAAVKECQRLGIPISSVDAAEAVGIAYWLNLQLFPYTPKANALFNLPPTVRAG